MTRMRKPVRWFWLVCLVLAPLFMSQAIAETPFSGAISVNTEWTSEGSPYLINGNVLVQQGVTLTIGPGVEVLFGEGRSMQIDGALIARGSEEHRIRFSSQASGIWWGYLSFEESSIDADFEDGTYVNGSILEYVDLEYAGYNGLGDPHPTVRTRNARPYFKDVSVRHGLGNGFYINADGLNQVTLLHAVDVSNNGRWGIEAYTALQIDRSRIVENDHGFWGGPATIRNTLFEGNTGLSISCSGAFENNRVVANREDVSIYCGADDRLTGNVIDGNTVGWIYLTGIVTHNIISSNTLRDRVTIVNSTNDHNVLADNRSTGGVAYIDGGTRNALVRNQSTGSMPYAILFNNTLTDSTFVHNHMSAAGTGQQVALLRPNSLSASLSGNNLFGNHADYLLDNWYANGTEYEARNNWWGSAEAADIQSAIHDFFVDASRGVVNYDPFLTTINTDAPISPPTGLVAEVSAGTIALSWSPNPESDLAGYKVYWGKEDAPFYEHWVDVGNVTSHTLEGLAEGAWFVGVTAYDHDYDAAADLPETVVNENMTAGHESWYTRVTANPLEASALSYDFGDLYTGFTASETFTVTNKGYTLHEITSVYLSGAGAEAFAIVEESCGSSDLSAGGSCQITVAFQPSSAGPKSATLSVTPANTNHLALNIELTGQAVATGDIVVPGVLDYDTVVLGGARSLPLRIDNAGTAALVIENLTLAGADAEAFRLQNSCSWIGSGSGCTVNIEFRPTTEGVKQAQLIISSDDPDEPLVTVALAGEAVAPLALSHLSVDRASGYAPLTVTFAATVQGGSGVYDFAWDFGQGLTSDQQNPGTTYSSAGTYTATLQVTDRHNPDNTVSGQLPIAVGATLQVLPVGITALSVDVASAVVPFEARFSVAPNGGSGDYSYAWTFGDGAASTDAHPSHTYTDTGSYTVVVTVSDNQNPGLSTTGQLEVLAVAAPTLYTPVSIAQLSASQVAGVAPMAVDFSITAAGGSGAYAYTWDFGDGTGGSGVAPQHSYVEEGSYRVTVTVEDLGEEGVSATGELMILVVPPPSSVDPLGIAQLAASNVVGVAPLAVEFEVAGSGASGDYTYHWDLGDGTTATGASPTHTYDAAGTYEVSVMVRDLANPDISTAGELLIQVIHEPALPNPLGIAHLSASNVAGVAPLAVEFAVEGSGGSGAYRYRWEFGDGSVAEGAAPSHTYAAPGTYQVSVVVEDLADPAQTRSAELTIVTLAAPMTLGVALTAEATGGTAPFSAAFQADISGGSAPYTVTWNFGDGTSRTQTVEGTTVLTSHTYTQAGFYQVSVIVSADGGAGTQSRAVAIGMALDVSEPATPPASTPDDGAGGGGGGGGVGYLFLLGGGLLLWRRGIGDGGSRGGEMAA